MIYSYITGELVFDSNLNTLSLFLFDDEKWNDLGKKKRSKSSSISNFISLSYKYDDGVTKFEQK